MKRLPGEVGTLNRAAILIVVRYSSFFCVNHVKGMPEKVRRGLLDVSVGVQSAMLLARDTRLMGLLEPA